VRGVKESQEDIVGPAGRSDLMRISIAFGLALAAAVAVACSNAILEDSHVVGVVYGRVTQPGGTGVAGALVSLVAHDSVCSSRPLPAQYAVTLTDSAGGYRVELNTILGPLTACVDVHAKPPSGQAVLDSASVTVPALRLKQQCDFCVPDSARADVALPNKP
jgi:hypothetical protein